MHSNSVEGHSLDKIVLITGGAKRLGREMVTRFHALNYRVIIHRFSSSAAANALAAELNELRADSVQVISGDITSHQAQREIVRDAINCFGGLDVLINNASSFYPNNNQQLEHSQWQDLVGTNMAAPYALSCLFAPYLSKRQGNIINMVDIHARKPLKDHTIYCMAKAGLEMMIKSLACEFAPDIRVNGIAPGAIMWPEQAPSAVEKQAIMDRIPLNKIGTPQDIAATAIFLSSAPYITGQVIAVDGGRSLT